MFNSAQLGTRTNVLSLLLATIVLSGLACSGGSANARSATGEGNSQGQGKVEVILLNGGGTANSNYLSHLTHLKRMRSVLNDAGIADENITIFSSDGNDETPDLASFADEGEKRWLMQNTNISRILGEPFTYKNAEVQGMRILPARKDSLDAWFALRGRLLNPGDTLLFYVTDHGLRYSSPDGPLSQIVMWGEHLLTFELGTMFEELNSEVRVVSLMSQCYSGGFGSLNYGPNARKNSCGFFSTIPSRQAYGCYPEAKGEKGNLGHTMRFAEALALGKQFNQAHAYVQQVDATPNIPVKSSSLFVAGLIATKAKKHKQAPQKTADSLIEQAWKNTENAEELKASLDSFSKRFAWPALRTLADVEKIKKELVPLRGKARRLAAVWEGALTRLANFETEIFRRSFPSWGGQNLTEIWQQQPRGSGSAEEAEVARHVLASALARKALKQLESFLQEQQSRAYGYMKSLRKKAELARQLAYELDVREAALRRAEHILLSVAGRYAANEQEDTRKQLSSLEKCEAFSFGAPAKRGGKSKKLPSQPPLAHFSKRLEELRPPHIGVGFDKVPDEMRKKFDLREGAAYVRGVPEGFPAAKAGIKEGDIILGTDDDLFEQVGAIQRWTMLSKAGDSYSINIMRNGARKKVQVTLGSYPDINIAPPPKAVEVGQKAPSLKGLKYVKGKQLPSKGTRLLFFFATWCKPCKNSLPHVLKLAKDKKFEIVAISSEDTKTIDEFLKKWDKPFPSRVAQDQGGAINRAYGIQGFPTYVLVDKGNRVVGNQTGFTEKLGFSNLLRRASSAPAK